MVNDVTEEINKGGKMNSKYVIKIVVALLMFVLLIYIDYRNINQNLNVNIWATMFSTSLVIYLTHYFTEKQFDNERKRRKEELKTIEQKEFEKLDLELILEMVSTGLIDEKIIKIVNFKIYEHELKNIIIPVYKLQNDVMNEEEINLCKNIMKQLYSLYQDIELLSFYFKSEKYINSTRKVLDEKEKLKFKNPSEVNIRKKSDMVKYKDDFLNVMKSFNR